MPTRGYLVNEVFLSEQGEGHHQGVPMVFVRFTGCNLRCSLAPGKRSPGGFDCDTEFVSGVRMHVAELLDLIQRTAGTCATICLTGGEPTLQTDAVLLHGLHERGYRVHMETNGSRPVVTGIDWLTVSPKVAEHAIRQRTADEVKYVRGYQQAIPRTVVQAAHRFISPAFNGMSLDEETLAWCKQLVAANPPWRLSVQVHKLKGQR